MSTESKSDMNTDPGLFETLRHDLSEGDLKKTVKGDYRQLRDFYLTEERKARLEGMGWFKRFYNVPWWMFKSLFFKLTPVRRILLVISLGLVFTNRGGGDQVNDLPLLGALILVFVLMLELREKAMARGELKEGHEVQQALMPEREPKVKGWSIWLYTRAANEVGGDMVDFIKLDEERYGVALGDVAGKGLGAALFMFKLQATLRALVPDVESLADLGTKINGIFHRDSLPRSFASFVYVILTSGSGELRFMNAGHLPPVVIKGTEIEELSKGGAALGIRRDEEYTEQSVEIDRGDILLLYSDGLTDARNDGGILFGEKRLFNVLAELRGLAAVDIGEGIVSVIDEYVGEAPQNDDISIAVLKRLQ